MTNLLLDATALADGSEYRGIGTYLRHLLTGLSLVEELSTTALVRPGTTLPRGIAPLSVRRIAPGRFRAAEHDVMLPWDLRRGDADVVHSPATSPPWRCRAPWIQTLHDVIPLVFDDPDLAGERRRWRRTAPLYRRAASVIAISRHAAETGVATLGLDPRRIEVIPHGVAPEFVPAVDQVPAQPPYLLLVGEYSRRKGYEEACAVVAALADRGYPHRLRITGRIAPWLRSTVNAVVGRAPRPDRVQLLGFVDDLVAEYQGAAALLLTSRYEGFGFPVLEAMACGTPVVAFSNSAITEIVADAGVLVGDGDVQAMAEAVRVIVDDPDRRADLAARGIEHARCFSWERSVAQHAEIYRAVAR